jgi:hypothetical protein
VADQCPVRSASVLATDALAGSFVGDVNGTLATEGMLAVPEKDANLGTRH